MDEVKHDTHHHSSDSPTHRNRLRRTKAMPALGAIIALCARMIRAALICIIGLGPLAVFGQVTPIATPQPVKTPITATIPVPRPSAGSFGASTADLRYENPSTTDPLSHTSPITPPEPLTTSTRNLLKTPLTTATVATTSSIDP